MTPLLRRHLLLLAPFSLLAAGCGGSGDTTVNPPTGSFNFSGANAAVGASQNAATVPATGGTTLTLSDGTTALLPSGSAPSGTTYPAGTQFVIIPAGVGFVGQNGPDRSVEVDGVAASGATVNADGRLTQAIALPASEAGILHTISFPSSALNTRVLNVGRIEFSGKFYLRLNPLRLISPIPTVVTGRIPNNGENAVGSSVRSQYQSGNNNRTARLTVQYGNGVDFTLDQTRPIQNGFVTHDNIVTDAVNVPANGVRLVRFVIGDL